MMKFKNLYILMAFSAVFFMSSCVDDEVLPEPPIVEPEEAWVDPNMPEEIRNGYSISFNMSLDPYGGPRTRVTNVDLLNIDNFIDLEKVRILFFVCADEGDGNKSAPDTTHVKRGYAPGIDNSDLNDPNHKFFFDGKNDHFLFESKSRWVSQLQDDESTTATWQVTAPVFKYGNNDDYRWDDIRYALENYPFKVVILANRPDEVLFGDFDGKFGDDKLKYPTGRGPVWGPQDSWLPVECRDYNDENKDKNKDYSILPTINDLHHCQYDVVYASKNSGDKSSTKNPYGGRGVYSFIMLDPNEDEAYNNGLITPPSLKPENEFTNRMGALSNWTYKPFLDQGNKDNYYFHPNQSQGIPMYGVQIFDPIPDWKKGTPFNISDRHYGQSGELIRKNVYMLRSLVKLELIIPREMKNKKGDIVPISITEAKLRYSNVMARCEPLDVATPMERLWHKDHERNDDPCEWFNIQDYGPIINQAFEDEGTQGDARRLQRRMAWFYGAWRDWWDYNYGKTGVTSEVLNTNNVVFNQYSTKPYPRIFNPVIQRNDDVNLEYCEVESGDGDFYHYVIYTGERNINDPTQFGQTDSFNAFNAKAVYFKITIQDDDSGVSNTYLIPLANYTGKNLASTYKFTNEDGLDNVTGTAKNYFQTMARSTEPEDWNYSFLRNHVYTFTIRSFGDYSDTGGLDVQVVSTENRTAPGFWFN